MPNTLTVNNLSCEKGEQLLFEKLSFALEQGEVMQIRGINGCGKTSLLRILAGIGFANSGEILWNNQLIEKNREQYQSAIHYIGHKLGLKDDLTATENLQFCCNILGRDDSEIPSILNALGFAANCQLLVRALSAGQKRRIALAKLMLLPARLWILDEPFTAIDQEGIGLLANLMEKHLANSGMIIFTSHQDIPLKFNKRELSLS